MNNKSLVLFSYDFPPSNGGIARLCQEIAVGMKQYYECVTVLTRESEGPADFYNCENIEVIRLPRKRISLEFSAYNYLIKLKNKKSVDVLCGVWHPEAAICQLAGIKNIFILGHGTEFLAGQSSFRKYFWLPFYSKWVLRKARMVIANSSYTKRIVSEIDQCIAVSALPLAVNESFFRPLFNNKDNSILQLCSLSRILKFKGYDFIARSIAELPSIYKERVRWNIGGTGPYLKELRGLVKELGIEQNVTFLGFIKEENLPSFYNSNDVFVLCTREEKNSTSVEGFGLVFLEAQSCGIPAIGTRTGGIADAIEDENGGWLIEQDDEEALNSLFIHLIENRDQLDSMALRARDRVVQKCTRDQYCNNLYEIISKDRDVR
ncbi:glycosyltransferase family 4 protein [Flavobacterium sp. XN-5]|uniref:glycosyltransferase family 4 protein n=1 Tax=Flavobacterium sp. XN-5 TaxID=2599390 RepID=UPI0011C7F31A|nr:glycosyltransferase family 4 protein [Flavobacterium sp. XN-5]NGY37421.1 glycosyltransferase family 4 protein [Flavobacterium sp. XN-5]